MLQLIISVIVFNGVVLFMRKRLTKLEMYATSLFALFLNNIADFCLNLQFNLYGYFEKGIDVQGYFVVYGIYPAINLLFLNFFPYHKRLISKAMYILGWTAFSLIYEWIAVLSKMFYYSGWKLIYSAPIYPVLFMMLLFNLKFIRWLISKHFQQIT